MKEPGRGESDFVGGQVAQTRDKKEYCGKSAPLLGQRFDADEMHVGSQVQVGA